MVLVISFSGGRTSAFMTKWLLDNCRHLFSKIIVLFANTGQEDEKTLQFIHNCDLHFGFDTVWLESVVHHGIRKANTHKIVTFETATRDGALFEEMIKKHGIPNRAFPHCTRELKLAPINSYLRSAGVKRGQRKMAIGIRIDEQRRVRGDATKENIIYPLVDMHPMDKQDILTWWEEQDFDLGIPEHHGNCVWCWKKSENKHMHLIHERPEIFDVPRRLEALYPHTGSHKDKTIPRTFFRGNTSTEALFKKYALLSGKLPILRSSDTHDGCSQSCELFPTE